ncbi:Glucose oxidase [Vanrija pseudolonga]|uniref:Glucose oxidase n=1 Tax=Vanrija pseudolonga TaxID=143232 RepID=A0AAF0Y6C6_9TREE|nr:Glucose oxidase [Vanrija pseudolonga]
MLHTLILTLAALSSTAPVFGLGQGGRGGAGRAGRSDSNIQPVHPVARSPLDSDYHHQKRSAENDPYDNLPRTLLKRSITSNVADVVGKSFDFVIVGGGLAGLTAASRLSEWSNFTVLVVEAGGDGSDVQIQEEVPGFSYMKGLTSTAYGWNFTTVNQTDCSNLSKHWPLGRGLGGSAAVNGMFWGRASAQEYDSWAALNPGGEQTWNWAEVDKYIKKSENFVPPDAAQASEFHIPSNVSAHGQGGPIQIGHTQYIFPITSNWIPTWEALGFTAKDLAAGDTHGVTITPSTLNPVNQTRSDSLRGYIQAAPPRPNLVILTGQQGTKLLFNGTKDAKGNVAATGVQFQAAPGAPVYTVNVTQEVIVTSGTVGTPKILQLSGVGPANVLTPLGITPIIDLPVGYNLQDHVAFNLQFNTVPGVETWYNLATNATLQADALAIWQANHTGPLTYVNEATGCKCRHVLADLCPNPPDITATDINAVSLGTIDINATVAVVTAKHGLPASVQKGLAAQYALQQQWLSTNVGQFEVILHLWGANAQNIVIQVAFQHAYTRGTSFIASTDPFAAPLIDPSYFGVDTDLALAQAGIAWVRKLAATQPLAGVLTGESTPGANVTGDALNTYIKSVAGTEFHPMGTCSMLPRDSGGVVDTNLVVYGTSNVRVLDSSIIPIEISAHLMATTYGIAEKGADIIKGQHWAVGKAQANNGTSDVGGGNGGKGGGNGNGNGNGGNSGTHSSASGLSTGARAGIAVGAIVGGLGIIGLAVWFFIRKLHKRPVSPTHDHAGWYNSDSYTSADGVPVAQVASKHSRVGGSTGSHPSVGHRPLHALTPGSSPAKPPPH